jgi:3-oxoacyl-[acyl-carrier-protein] synthase II
MGEEAAGVEALRVALKRIEGGQGDLFLVGGSFNAERKDLVLLYQLGKALWQKAWKPLWERGENGGFILGSLGAFVVLEARAHAEARGAKPLARLLDIVSDRSRREPGTAAETARRLWDALAPQLRDGPLGVISGATGAEPATREEREFLASIEAAGRPLAVRGIGGVLGHGVEAQFPAGVALAALALARGGFYPPLDPSGYEKPIEAAPGQVLVTGFGHWRGEGLALLEAVV